MTLAINGGEPEVEGVLERFDTIGEYEENCVNTALNEPLSGFLGGQERGGRWVRALEDRWALKLGVKHAIACNSATSGLMAAAFAVGLKPGDEFLCPAMTMSATAAAPMFTGAKPRFCDVSKVSFQLAATTDAPGAHAVFLTHLFGLAVNEDWFVNWTHQDGVGLVVDASQSPLAICDDVYAGTLGDIGVFSFNVHKHLQAGEGGLCVTNDDVLADRLRRFINHGEMAGGAIGLNLRMTEVCAAIAIAQLIRSDEIIGGRIAQAEALINEIKDIPNLSPPYVPDDCKHVYYTIPFTVSKNRKEFVAALRAEGVPLVEGYVAPLYRLPAFEKYKRPCPVAEDLHDHSLFMFENCAWTLTDEQIKQVGRAFHKVVEEVKL